MKLTRNAKSLLEGPNFAAVATIQPDGSPQASVVWVEAQGDRILFGTAIGRAKERNLRRDPRVAVTVWDAANPYRQSMIRGRVVEMTEAGAEETIDRLAVKYTGQPFAHRRPGEKRVTVLIEPESIFELA